MLPGPPLEWSTQKPLSASRSPAPCTLSPVSELLCGTGLSELPGLCSSSLDQTRSDVSGLVDPLAVDAIEKSGPQRGIKRALLVP